MPKTKLSMRRNPFPQETKLLVPSYKQMIFNILKDRMKPSEFKALKNEIGDGVSIPYLEKILTNNFVRKILIDLVENGGLVKFLMQTRAENWNIGRSLKFFNILQNAIIKTQIIKQGLWTAKYSISRIERQSKQIPDTNMDIQNIPEIQYQQNQVSERNISIYCDEIQKSDLGEMSILERGISLIDDEQDSTFHIKQFKWNIFDENQDDEKLSLYSTNDFQDPSSDL